jgi:pimeloyl-ACP methyl ester carboxylesterase
MVSMVAGVEKREVMLHGHRVAVRLCGLESGRPVLLLIHGLAGSSSTWRTVMPALSERYAVVAPDLLGHGASDKPRHDYSPGAFANVLRDLMRALAIERATLVGHSLGGGIAMQFAYQHPEWCERLVLVSSGGLGREVSWMLRAVAVPGTELLMPAVCTPFIRCAGNLLGTGLRRLGWRDPEREEEWRTYATLADRANRQPFVRTLRSVIDTTGQVVNAHDRLHVAAQVPTLIVWGGRDRIIPVAHGHAAHAAIGGSELVVFDRSGHFPHVEEPVSFVEVVTEFLDGTHRADYARSSGSTPA